MGEFGKWLKWKKVMKKLKEEVEKKGFKLSVTENRAGGEEQDDCVMWFLGNELRQYSKEGVTMADIIDLGMRVKMLGARSKVRFSIIKRYIAFQKSCMKVGVKKLF